MASGEFCGWLDVASGKRVVCEEAAALGKVTILTKRTCCFLRVLFFILCAALFLRVGDSSGAILGVRSVALLHLGLLHGGYKVDIKE